MSTREKIELMRRVHLIRENNEKLILQAAKEKSSLTKPMVDLGSSENPVPTRGKLAEAPGDFDQSEESFFDKTDLLNWVDDLVDEWGMEPDFDEVWSAMQKEAHKFKGFADNLGLGLMTQIVKTELADKALRGGDTDVAWAEDDDPMYEASEKPWMKSRDRREEHQKEIEQGVLENVDLESNGDSVVGALTGSEDVLRKLEQLDSEGDARVAQKLKFATRDAKQLISSVRELVFSLKSGVVAEGKKMKKKTNLETLLEQHMDDVPGAENDRLAERIQKVLSLLGEEGAVEDIAGLLRYASEAQIAGLRSAVLKLELMADRISNAIEAVGRRKDAQRYGRKG